LNRRAFIQAASVTAGALALGACERGVQNVAGRLVADPQGLVALPRGFRATVVSKEGRSWPGPKIVPGRFDGMAAFDHPAGVLLVRNHEQTELDDLPVHGVEPFDRSEAGGTTGVLLSRSLEPLREVALSAGTRRNCAGGVTPWGTWLTCEEALTDGHGYVFEVVPDGSAEELARTPIRAMGKFAHEAAGIDPATGIVYLSEDHPTASFLYRFLPNDRRRRPGSLLNGGRLQALRIQDDSGVPRVGWVDVDPDTPHDDAVDLGAAAFRRLEGAVFARGAFWLPDTSGGRLGLGQIYRYTPGINRIELMFESDRSGAMQKPDNLTMTPWGDIWLVEDGPGTDRLMGLTPEGVVYEFARNLIGDGELSGPCFSPDGQTLFVNLFSPGHTLAIRGPFRAFAARRRARNAAATGFVPPVHERLAEAAARLGLRVREAAAFDRLGAPVA
jgi:uncharacterized protein